MSDTLKYKDFQGSVEYSADDRTLYGQVLFIDSLISYQGQDIDELEAAFHSAIDHYIDRCNARGLEPNKTYSGNFNIRPGPHLHRELAQKAKLQNKSLNEAVKEAIEQYLSAGEPLIINNVENHYHGGETRARQFIPDFKGEGSGQWQRKH